MFILRILRGLRRLRTQLVDKAMGHAPLSEGRMENAARIYFRLRRGAVRGHGEVMLGLFSCWFYFFTPFPSLPFLPMVI